MQARQQRVNSSMIAGHMFTLDTAIRAHTFILMPMGIPMAIRNKTRQSANLNPRIQPLHLTSITTTTRYWHLTHAALTTQAARLELLPDLPPLPPA